MPNSTLNSWQDELPDGTTKFALRAYGVRIGLRTNDPTWLPRVAAVSYPPTWQPIATTSKIDRLYTLRITPSTFTLLEEAETAITSRSRRAVLEDLERRMKIYVAEMAPRCVFVHAGVVGWQGRAIVLRIELHDDWADRHFQPLVLPAARISRRGRPARHRGLDGHLRRQR